MFQEEIKKKMDEYVHGIYVVTRNFPKEEIYGATSQIRRASLSIILNYIEGFARQRRRVTRNFYEISYGSLQESRYLLEFSQTEGWLSSEECGRLSKFADEIGAMLWVTLKGLKDSGDCQ